MREETRNWLKQADHDLKTAKLLYRNKVYDSAAFHSFQSSEKALKALSYSLGHAPEKTHNLIELASTLDMEVPVMDELKKLTPHYIVSRYPDAANGIPSEIYTEGVSDECVGSAEKVLKWVKEVLKN